MREPKLPPLDDDKILDAPSDLDVQALEREGLGFYPQTRPSGKPRGGGHKLLWTVVGFLLGIGVAGVVFWELGQDKKDSVGQQAQEQVSRPLFAYPVSGIRVEKKDTSGGSKGTSPIYLVPLGEILKVRYGKETVRFVSVEREKSPWAALLAAFTTPPEPYLDQKALKPGEELTGFFAPEKSLHYDLALKTGPDSPALAKVQIELEMTSEAWLMRARELKDPKDQRACLEKALEKDPSNVDILLALGNILWEMQDPLAAAEIFERVLKASPRNKEAASALSTIYFKSKPKRALEMYRLLAEVDSDHRLDHLKRVAELQERLGVSPVETYNKILAIQKNDPDAQRGLASIYAKYVEKAQHAEKKGDLAQAIGEMEQALKLNPTKEAKGYLATLHNNLAYSLAQKGDHKKAIVHYEESLKLEESPVTYLNLADAYAKTKQADKAIKALEKAWALKPKEAQVVKNILLLWAELLSSKKDFRGAIAKLEELREKFPNDPDIAKTLAAAYWNEKDLNKALEVLKTVPPLMKSHPPKEKAEVHRMLGDLYRALGDREKDIKKRISRYDEALKEYKNGLALVKDKELEKRKEELEAERMALVKRSLRS